MIIKVHSSSEKEEQSSKLIYNSDYGLFSDAAKMIGR